MILKIINNIYPGEEVRGQLYNKLSNLLDVFYDSPRFTMQSVTIDIAYKVNGNRKYLFMLTTTLTSEDELRGIVYYIEENCRSKNVDFESIERMYLRVTLVKDRI